MRVLYLVALFFSIFSCAYAKTVQVLSPDGKIRVDILDDGASPKYRVFYQRQEILAASRLGIAFKQHSAFGEGYSIINVDRGHHDEIWSLPWGERKTVRSHFNEASIAFTTEQHEKHSFIVRFRVFNDGIGFRYEVPKQIGLGAVEITDELTEFVSKDSHKITAWWIPGRGWNRYEYLYNTTPLSQIDRAHTPLTYRLASGVHVSIHEAALIDYAGMVIDQQRPGHLKADLTPWSDGIRVKTHAPFKTPWRTLQISPDAVGLLNSNLILNLNEPNVLGDVSWVKPGKYMGIWWGMHVGENTWSSGPKHGATTSNTKKLMDFSAKYGFSGVLVEGWNIGWDGDWYHNGDIFNFTKSYADFDLKNITEYGQSIGVELIGHHETSGNVTNYKKQMAAAYDLYHKHGVTQVKTGYVADAGKIKRVDEAGIAHYEWHDGQFMVGEYLRSVKAAAQRKMSINTHEPVKDTGLRRTYPNWLSREGARGQEYNAWGNPPNSPEHTAILPYTRMLSGPMDFTPGIFNLTPHGKASNNRVQTTLAKQLALYVVIYSPIQMVADFPRHYEDNLKAFQFIVDVPTDWQQSIALAGDVGDYIVMVRKDRHSDNWYLGALTDEHSRQFTVSLDFLDKGAEYSAIIYRDGDNADWRKNPHQLVVEKKVYTQNDHVNITLALGGGTAISFQKN